MLKTFDNILSRSFSFMKHLIKRRQLTKSTQYEKPNPMDRLICGDVGFGKTEIAIRAIFKAYLSHKLSVFLCPTTILADQHYMTCHDRLTSLGLSVGLLSRFKSKAQQTQIIKDLLIERSMFWLGHIEYYRKISSY